MKPDPRVLDDLVKRIRDAVHPLRIILFGSAARGEMGPDSDLDVLVVMPDGTHRLHTSMNLHRQARGLGVPKDILVATESDVRAAADNPYVVLHDALRDGVELYRAAASP